MSVCLYPINITGGMVVWLLNRECSIVEKFFRIHLRHIKRFNDVELMSLSANSTFKTIHLRESIERRLQKNLFSQLAPKKLISLL